MNNQPQRWLHHAAGDKKRKKWEEEKNRDRQMMRDSKTHEKTTRKRKREGAWEREGKVTTEITQTGSWCQRQRKPHLCT